ncbi:MAG: site-specific integrase [Deltaproteobacteria bacterium]|nr:site-specific integrase [Deltaproteobacteria bacterium]
MSVYSVKGKGWRYDFTLKGIRHTSSWFKKKTETKRAEAKRREEILNPKPIEETRTDMGFLELLNNRLDYIKAYNSSKHYRENVYYGKRWLRQWKNFRCSEITGETIESYILKRSRQVSNYTANKELRYLRAIFNWGMKPERRFISNNPTAGLRFLPVEKRLKYVPPKEDVLRVIMAAEPDVQDYLWTIAMTMARVSEINNLTWDDVNLNERYLVLYTRKKRGGHLTPRKVTMSERLFRIMSRRYEKRDKRKPWVFWHRYWSRKKMQWVESSYDDRKRIMETLCKKAKVKYFRFHALRHFGASLLDQMNIPIGTIQRLLGHENRTTTEIYLHSFGDSERKAAEIFDIVFEEKVSHNSHIGANQN